AAGADPYFFFRRKGGRSRSSPFTTFGLTPSKRPRGAVSKESSGWAVGVFTPSFSLGGSAAAFASAAGTSSRSGGNSSSARDAGGLGVQRFFPAPESASGSSRLTFSGFGAEAAGRWLAGLSSRSAAG